MGFNRKCFDSGPLEGGVAHKGKLSSLIAPEEVPLRELWERKEPLLTSPTDHSSGPSQAESLTNPTAHFQNPARYPLPSYQRKIYTPTILKCSEYKLTVINP